MILIGLNTVAAVVGPLPFRLLGISGTIFDVGGLLTLLAMLGLLAARVASNLRRLSALEPPRRGPGA